jgi:hypothetical protein
LTDAKRSLPNSIRSAPKARIAAFFSLLLLRGTTITVLSHAIHCGESHALPKVAPCGRDHTLHLRSFSAKLGDVEQCPSDFECADLT